MEMSLARSASKAPLTPACPLPPSARSVTLVAGLCTVMFPVQLPLVKRPETTGVMGTAMDAPTTYLRSTSHHLAESERVGKVSPEPSRLTSMVPLAKVLLPSVRQ